MTLISGDDELVVTARITSASNLTLLGHIGDESVVYKPVSGERPLWDFPDGTLAAREVATHLVSQVFGGDLVPRTVLRDGPLGPGMVQTWCDTDPDHEAVILVPAEDRPEGWRHVLDGFDPDDRPVSLLHEDSPALRRLAVFDLVVNNADRKGGHVLATPGGGRVGIDHGLTFHAEHKLRTVLWGWLDEELSPDERSAVAAVLDAVNGPLGDDLAPLLTTAEIEALGARCERLLAVPVFPAPRGHMPAVPWPPF